MAAAGGPAELPVASGLAQICRIMSEARRRQLHALLALVLVAALAELAAIGSVLPFLGLLTDSPSLGRLPRPGDRLAGLASASDPLLPVGHLFAAVVVIAAAIRLRLDWSVQQAPVLVLEVATVAAVTVSLASLGATGRTIIIIAPRASTVARCDRVARLHKGPLVESGAVSGGTRRARSGARP